MELANVKKAVCLIQCTGEENQVLTEGTGFHFGRGWIMSVAHNFQDDQETDQTVHNFMSRGKFKVTWNGHTFGEHKRMAFVHHLKPGKYTDFQNTDIAMFKLGIQYEHARKKENYTPWEKSEDEMLKSMEAASCAIANDQFDAPPSPKEGENVYAFHYGGASNTLQEEQPIKITKITPGSGTVPVLQLEKSPGVLPHGSSGCPVMIKSHGKFYLAGLHFSGNPDDKSGWAKALPWDSNIKEYINKGVGIIAVIGSYLAFSSFKEGAQKAKDLKSDLESTAGGANLTIYLVNGEVIKGNTVE